VAASFLASIAVRDDGAVSGEDADRVAAVAEYFGGGRHGPDSLRDRS
jgi:thymidine phosphorylase